MRESFPRLLIVTEFPPNATGGGPAIIRQMLRDWPNEKLDWWSCLGESSNRPSWPVRQHAVASIPYKLYPHRKAAQVKGWLLARYWSRWAAKHLMATIEKFEPDVIWAIPHLWSILPLATVLPSLKIPYHISIHDLPDAHHLEKKIGNNLVRNLLTRTEDLYRNAATTDVISSAMADDLKQKTGRSVDQILHAGVEEEQLQRVQQRRRAARDTIKITYAGTIVAEETFGNFVASLERIRGHLSRPVELHLFGALSYRLRPWFNAGWIIEHGDLVSDELENVLEEFDWGFAPMELTDENARYNRFSLPTKAVTYLAAGLGLITIGHRSSTIANLARRYAIGIVVEDGNLDQIDQLLIDGLSEKDVWGRWGSEIIRCVRTEFDATAMRNKLYNRLTRTSLPS